MNSYSCDQGNHQDCTGLTAPGGKRKAPTRCGCPCHQATRIKAPTPTPDVVKTPRS